MFEVQVFSGVGPILNAFAIRYVSNVGVFRLRHATGIAYRRLFCFSAINANTDVGLHRAFFQATVNVNGIISFVRFSTRSLRVLGIAGI